MRDNSKLNYLYNNKNFSKCQVSRKNKKQEWKYCDRWSYGGITTKNTKKERKTKHE